MLKHEPLTPEEPVLEKDGLAQRLDAVQMTAEALHEAGADLTRRVVQLERRLSVLERDRE